jgi:hypothetical protein
MGIRTRFGPLSSSSLNPSHLYPVCLPPSLGFMFHPIEPKIMTAKRPECHRKHKSQKGSLALGGTGNFCSCSTMEKVKATVRPCQDGDRLLTDVCIAKARKDNISVRPPGNLTRPSRRREEYSTG